jgi:hypothetical protein
MAKCESDDNMPYIRTVSLSKQWAHLLELELTA